LKVSTKASVIAKLWFIPGILKIVVVLIQVIAMVQIPEIPPDFYYYIIQSSLGGLLNVIIIFLLGYWIYYIYSVNRGPLPQSAGNYGYQYNAGQQMPAAPPPNNRFCGTCGSEIISGDAFCRQCGRNIADKATGTGYTTHAGPPPPYGGSAYVQDAPSGGFAALGFFFPVVGLILYLVWRDALPLRARSAGKGAIAGVLAYVALVIVLIILQIALLSTLFW
jgi:hypothetical protein